MNASGIRKSLVLDSEPVLRWPTGAAKVVCWKGFEAIYAGEGWDYLIKRKKGRSVVMVQCEVSARKNEIFSSGQPNELTWLRRLAELHDNYSPQSVCKWVARYGLLGFRPREYPSDDRFMPVNVREHRGLFYPFEPLDYIRRATHRAVNVLALWSALKRSYQIDKGGSIQEIQSIVHIGTDSGESIQKGNGPIQYPVFVNGERRSFYPIPKTSREWRHLAASILETYIWRHITEEVVVDLELQERSKDEEVRGTEQRPDLNIKPVWRINSALAAYYVELLMVMRHFRSCNICGKDISHQKATSIYCGSTCRSKKWHRDKSAERKVAKSALH